MSAERKNTNNAPKQNRVRFRMGKDGIDYDGTEGGLSRVLLLLFMIALFSFMVQLFG